jgi:hypothetical protein
MFLGFLAADRETGGAQGREDAPDGIRTRATALKGL